MRYKPTKLGWGILLLITIGIIVWATLTFNLEPFEVGIAISIILNMYAGLVWSHDIKSIFVAIIIALTITIVSIVFYLNITHWSGFLTALSFSICSRILYIDDIKNNL